MMNDEYIFTQPTAAAMNTLLMLLTEGLSISCCCVESFVHFVMLPSSAAVVLQLPRATVQQYARCWTRTFDFSYS